MRFVRTIRQNGNFMPADVLNAQDADGASTQPIVEPETLQLRRAIVDPAQGFSIYNRLRTDNHERNKKAAAIQRKMNDEQPFNQGQLNSAKQSWRRNASTGFMSGMVNRITPGYKQLVDTSRLLTHSHLRSDDEAAVQKSETFQIYTTKFLRSWREWQNFWNSVCVENITFGYTGACNTDETSWQPIFCRQDEALFPENCPMVSDKVPLWCKLQNFMVHEMVAYLADPEASAAAGWDIENLIAAINSAKPNDSKTDNARKREDIYRETSMGTSYSEGVKVIQTVHLFVQESWGPISHYIYSKPSGKLLFLKYDRFESMSQCLTLMTLETGNGKLHGSKGVGRKLYNTAISIEQARNRIVDNLYLNGLLLLKETAEAKPQQGLVVAHPVAVIGQGYEVVKESFDVNYKAFEAIDQHMTNVAQQQVGAFMPGQTLSDKGSGDPTASEINYIASIEQVIREGALSHFWYQALTIISEIQRRIYSVDNLKKAFDLYTAEQLKPVQRVEKHMKKFYETFGHGFTPDTEIQFFDNSDPEDQAVRLIIDLFEKGLTPEEIYEMANCPANQVIDDDAQMNLQAISTIVSMYSGNPNINQAELRKMHISKLIGYAAFEKLNIDEQDNTVKQEATRLQLMEITSIMGGDEIPVSPRDADTIHMDTIMGKSANILQGQIPPTPQSLQLAQSLLSHFQQHLQQAIHKNENKEDGLDQYVQFARFAAAELQQFEKTVLGGVPGLTPIPKMEHGIQLPGPLPPPPMPTGTAPDPAVGPLSAVAPAPAVPGVNTPNLPPPTGPGKPLPATPLVPNAHGEMPKPLSTGTIKLS